MYKIFLLSIVLFSATLCPAQTNAVAQQGARLVEIGKPVISEIRGGELQTYLLKRPVNAVVHIHVKQDSAWLHLKIYGRDDNMLQEFWSVPKGDTAYTYTTSSPLHTLMTESTMDYRFELHNTDSFPVRFELSLEPLPGNIYEMEHQQIEATTKWVSKNAIPLRSLNAGTGFTDLLPLKNILHDARVVGLGEATHGSKEFFQFKHRMIEFLVREMGFTVFGLESSQSGCQSINDYVLYGKGDVKQALAGQRFWQWDTQEVLAMIEWMRKYNETVAEKAKVKFYGFDFQANDVAIEGLLDYLKKVAPQELAGMTTSLKPLIADDPVRRTYVKFYTFSPQEKVPISSRVNELFHFLDSNKTELTRRSSAGEFEQAFQYARLLTQFVDAYSREGFSKKDATSGNATRDRYMAENIARILQDEGDNARMIIWTHNGHANTSAYNMGYYLRQAFGKQYYAFGFSFNGGSFQALEIGRKPTTPLKEFTLGPALQGSVGWVFSRPGEKNFMVNFRSAPTSGPVADWLNAPHAMRSIGNGYAPANASGYYDAPVIPRESFDGLIYIEKTTRAIPNTKMVE